MHAELSEVKVTDDSGFDRSTGTWWFAISVNDSPVYTERGYPNQGAMRADMVRYRAMAEALAQRASDKLRREAARPYTVLIVADTREIANALVSFVRWRLGDTERDMQFLSHAYGVRLPSDTRVDGIVFVEPAGKLDVSSMRAYAGFLSREREGRDNGWLAYIGGKPPWPNAKNLLSA